MYRGFSTMVSIFLFLYSMPNGVEQCLYDDANMRPVLRLG